MMKITIALLTIIAESLLFSAMFLHPILTYLAWIVFGLDALALAAYWHEVARSEDYSMVSVLLFAVGFLLAVITGGLSL